MRSARGHVVPYVCVKCVSSVCIDAVIACIIVPRLRPGGETYPLVALELDGRRAHILQTEKEKEHDLVIGQRKTEKMAMQNVSRREANRATF